MNRKERFFCFVLILFILTVQCCLLFFSRSLLWLSVSCSPIALVALVISLKRAQRIKPFLVFYCYLVIFLGPFASLGCLLILVLNPRSRIREDYRSTLTADVVFTPSERMALGLRQHSWEEGDSGITPYIDAMEGFNPQLKRSTINKVVQHPGPSSRVILDIGLKDKDPDIRFYAASALILLNDSFIKDFGKIQEKIQMEPNNPMRHYELAATYDRYCTWRLPESDDYAAYYHKMEQSYQTALVLNPNYLNALIGLTRVLIKTKNYTTASETLHQGLDLHPNSVILALLQLTLLFRQKKFMQLKQVAANIAQQFPHVSLEIQEAIGFWLQPDRLEKGYEYYVS